jgi:hypothetical protein
MGYEACRFMPFDKLTSRPSKERGLYRGAMRRGER